MNSARKKSVAILKYSRINRSSALSDFMYQGFDDKYANTFSKRRTSVGSQMSYYKDKSKKWPG